jgi:tetratricopeptide (TPR) repeat protein
MSPSHPEALVNLAIARKNLGDLSPAEELCRKALEIDPALPERAAVEKALKR